MDQIAEVIPLKVTVPQTSHGPNIMEIIDSYASVRAIFIERDSIESIPDLWRNSCGFYILFSPLNADGSYSVYVGKSDRDFRRRLRSHNESKDYWTSALLIQRDSVEKLTSTHASFLEGAMRDIFDAAPHVTCHNIKPTGDHTIDSNEHMVMRQVVDSTLRMMAVRGYRKSLLPPSFPTQPATEPVRSVPAPASMAPSQPSSRQATSPAPAHREAPKLSMSAPSGKHSVLPASPEPSALQVAEVKAESMKELTFPTDKKASLFSMLFGGTDSKAEKPQKKPYDRDALWEELSEWRKETAKTEHLSVNYVLDTYILGHLADKHPQTKDALLTIPGIKDKRAAKYGDALLEILTSYAEK